MVIEFCEAFDGQAHKLLADQDAPLAPKGYIAIEVRVAWLAMIDMNRVDSKMCSVASVSPALKVQTRRLWFKSHSQMR